VSLSGEDELEVRVDLTNRGAGDAAAVSVLGELAGHYDEARIAAGVRAGATGAARLLFPRDVPRAGVYPVVLRLDYAPRTAVAGGPAALSQRAFLLVTLGANAPPAVRLSAPETTLVDRSLLPVTIESADGGAHRVRLRVLTPRGFNPERAQDEVAVPARGAETVTVPLLRGSVPRSSRQGVLLVAETLDGEVARTSTATTAVWVAGDPARLPRLRAAIVVAGALLLAAAAVLEWRHLRQAHRARLAPPAEEHGEPPA